MFETGKGCALADDTGKADHTGEVRRQNTLLKAGALQNAILASPNFSIIVTDEKGIIQSFNVGAERMLGYTAAEVVNRISPSRKMTLPKGVAERIKSPSRMRMQNLVSRNP